MHRIDLKKIRKYSRGCKFIIETGSGKSTKILSSIAVKYNSKFISIEVNKNNCKIREGVEYINGWSVSFEDVIKIGDDDFCYRPYLFKKKYRKRKFSDKELFLIENKDNGIYRQKYYTNLEKDIIDRKIAFGDKLYMVGETDIIRKALKKYKNLELDFFLCDSGEYCGLAEWNIVKNEIRIGGYFAIHDIYYPKSIKGFKVVAKIKENKNWEKIVQTKTKQGLFIAIKIL